MLHKPPDTNALDGHPDERHDGSTAPFAYRWTDTAGDEQWGLSRTPNNNLALDNYTSDTTAFWVTPDDTLHVQSITIEGESGIDAGTLDGIDSSQFVRSDADTTVNANLDVTGTLSQSGNRALTTADEGSLNAGTLGGASLTETRPAVSEDGTTVATAAETLDLGQYLQASASGGTVTLDSTGGNAVGSTQTASGDGTQTTFTLAHDLGATPASVDVTPLSAAAMGDHYVDPDSVTATSFDVVYDTAPPSGTDNLDWYVTATGNDGSGLHTIAVDDDGTRVDLVDTIDFAGGLDVTTPSDGAAAVSSPPGVDVRDAGTGVQSATTHIDFGANLTASGDGDGVTVEGSDTYPSVSVDGTTVLAAPTDVNFASNLSVVDDTDDTVTVHASDDASTLDGVDANQFLRSDVDDAHDATLSVSRLDAATDDGTLDVVASLATAPDTGLTNTVGSSTHHIRARREGIHNLSGGAATPTDYGTTLEADATVAFVETDNDRVAGWYDTNNESLTAPGGVRVGDSGGPADAALDVRDAADFNGNEVRGFVLEQRTDDPESPEPGRMWVRTDL